MSDFHVDWNVERKAALRASPWWGLTLLLYGSQVFAVFDSEFTMPITLLQVPFILAFLAFIYAIARARVLDAEDAAKLE